MDGEQIIQLVLDLSSGFAENLLDTLLKQPINNKGNISTYQPSHNPHNSFFSYLQRLNIPRLSMGGNKVGLGVNFIPDTPWPRQDWFPRQVQL
jgi:hypothetical protein